MKITMDDSHIGSLKQIKEFLKLDSKFDFKLSTKKEKYTWIEEVLRKFKYVFLKKKKEKMIVKKYICKITTLSKARLTKLIWQYKQSGKLVPNYHSLEKTKFPVKYFAMDIARLIDTDTAHRCLNGKATKEIMRREFEVFGKFEYENISRISISHLYNLRNHNLQYESSPAMFFKHTDATQVNIGLRKKPRPDGKPGFLRIDTVHQGDLNGVKGVYHINIVDEVTQYEFIATVEGISEKYLLSVIEDLLGLFPFEIYEFHSDNGSEFINRKVADILNRLHIRLTKSRSRHTNDNALVESKNGSIIRKMFGRNFINRKYASIIQEFNQKYFNLYLIYHRPCQFASQEIDKRGKIKKKYDMTMMPYEKLKSLPNAKQYLRAGFAFEELDKIAYAESDNEFAKKMMEAKTELFKKIK